MKSIGSQQNAKLQNPESVPLPLIGGVLLLENGLLFQKIAMGRRAGCRREKDGLRKDTDETLQWSKI